MWLLICIMLIPLCAHRYCISLRWIRPKGQPYSFIFVFFFFYFFTNSSARWQRWWWRWLCTTWQCKAILIRKKNRQAGRKAVWNEFSFNCWELSSIIFKQRSLTWTGSLAQKGCQWQKVFPRIKRISYRLYSNYPDQLLVFIIATFNFRKKKCFNSLFQWHFNTFFNVVLFNFIWPTLANAILNHLIPSYQIKPKIPLWLFLSDSMHHWNQ